MQPTVQFASQGGAVSVTFSTVGRMMTYRAPSDALGSFHVSAANLALRADVAGPAFPFEIESGSVGKVHVARAACSFGCDTKVIASPSRVLAMIPIFVRGSFTDGAYPGTDKNGVHREFWAAVKTEVQSDPKANADHRVTGDINRNASGGKFALL